MTSLYPHQTLEDLGRRLFVAVGTPENEAQIVSGHLVESSLMGHDSHGVMRIPEYLDLIEQGRVTPGGAITVKQTSSTTSIIDCGGNFGQVGGRAAVEDAVARATEHQVDVELALAHAPHANGQVLVVDEDGDQTLV